MNRTRSRRPDFRGKKSASGNRWYDLYEDWDLIDASFTAQYGIRLRQETEMPWGEFCTLLAGIMPETPLGQVVSIRSENNKDILKSFSPDQNRIRNEWRSGEASRIIVDVSQAADMMREFQDLCRQAFSK
jgi:hypothetical protein